LKILILRAGALGDLILTLPVLREIRVNFPKAEVVLWGIFPQARLAAPEFVDLAERLDALELSPLFVDGPLSQTVRNKLDGFDLAVSFLSDPDSVITRNLTEAGVKKVVAVAGKIGSEIHAVFHLAEVLGQLGLTLHDPVPRLSVGPKPAHSSKLVFHVGSGSPLKNWPIDRWIQLTQVLDPFFTDFLLVGGEADEGAARDFLAGSRMKSLRTLLKASLVDLSRALNECTVFIGHDTGVTHLAAAIGIPTIALFGPTNPDVWAPLGRHVTVLRNPDVSTAAETCRRLVVAAGRR
jgi:heptosyltransferase III